MYKDYDHFEMVVKNLVKKIEKEFDKMGEFIIEEVEKAYGENDNEEIDDTNVHRLEKEKNIEPVSNGGGNFSLGNHYPYNIINKVKLVAINEKGISLLSFFIEESKLLIKNIDEELSNDYENIRVKQHIDEFLINLRNKIASIPKYQTEVIDG